MYYVFTILSVVAEKLGIQVIKAKSTNSLRTPFRSRKPTSFRPQSV